MKTRLHRFKIPQVALLAAAALSISAVQPAAASMFDSGYAQEPIGEYKGLSQETLKYLGGPQGLALTIDIFYDTVKGDNRINRLMEGASVEQMRAQKTAMVQTLMGTPSIAPGTQQTGIRQLTTTQYNALAEDLYLAMETTRTPYSVQNRVMSSLSAYTPAFVSAYVLGQPSVDQGTLNDRLGTVQVGQPGI
jgi:hemoglobin